MWQVYGMGEEEGEEGVEAAKALRYTSRERRRKEGSRRRVKERLRCSRTRL